MAEKNTGKIVWHDLTVKDAGTVKSFYEQVVGWKSGTVSMGDYDDFTMAEPVNGETVTGICHARGSNEGLPAQWLIYISVENIEESAKACEQNGGKILRNIWTMENYGRFCIIEDPAGAVSALFEPAEK